MTERIERILKLWKEKTKDYEKIYNEAAQIFNEIQQLQTRQKKLAFTDKNFIKDVQELTNQIQKHMFKGWQT
ncbi:MAG: hypothetical protein ACUVTL_07035 [Thermoproteota archaeon]